MSIEASLKAFEEAQSLIPGGVNSPVRAFKSVGGVPRFIAEGNGAYLKDIDGNKYLDFVQSWGPLIFGHRDEAIEKAVINAVKKGLSFGAPTQKETDLASLVVSFFDSIDKVRFVSSGTEAVMSAIRLARGFTHRDDIVKFKGCYHGHSDSLLVEAGSGAVTFGNPSSPGVPADFTKHTLLADYNDIQSVKKCFSDSNDIACVIIEPIAGNMGFIPADKEFLKELRELCDANGTLLIFDEVMSGFRATINGSESITETKPDIVTLGKVIGGGMPVGAFGARAEIMAELSPEGPVYQAGTLSGNPVAMAAGFAALSKLKQNQNIISVLEGRAKRLLEGMKEEASKNGIKMQTNFIGSMFGFFFNDNEVKNFVDACNSDAKLFAKFHSMMLDEGCYFACSQYETSFISTAITDEMIEDAIKASAKVFKSIANG